MIKTFRGILAPDEVQQIRLGTMQGLIGYSIVKFQAVSNSPAGNSPESVIQVWRDTPDFSAPSITNFNIDFSVPNLLGAIFYENNQAIADFGGNTIIFDRETFNQDIYITCASTDGSMNYYLELEQIDLSLDEATVATLKDMRGRE
jgi:hypothetical protein